MDKILYRTQSKQAGDWIEEERLGRRIAELRVKAGMTQAQLADGSGMTQSCIARLESGKHSPTLEVLNRVAEPLGYKVELVKIMVAIIILLASVNCTAASNYNANAKQANSVELVKAKKPAPKPTGRQWKGKPVYRGEKGGLWYWHTPKTGKNAGKQVKRYLNKKDKERFNAGQSE